MIPAARANAILDTEYVTGDKLSLHTAYSTSGANEVTGGTYARVAMTWNAAASRAKTNNGNVDINVPAGNSIAFIGIWNSTGTTFKGMSANGGSEKTFQLDLANNRVYCEGHGLANDNRVVFTGATVPTGLTEGTIYWVVGVTAGDPDYFQVSSSQGGAAIDITGQHSDDCRVSKLVLEAYAADGIHRVSSLSVGL